MKKYPIIAIVAIIAVCLLVFAVVNDKEPVPLDQLPPEYTLEDAAKDNCVIITDGDVADGEKEWKDFIKITSSGKAASVRLIHHYTLGDPAHYDPQLYEQIRNDYPKMYIIDLSYNGETYTVRSYQDGQEVVKTYKYLMEYQGKAESKFASYSKYLRYVLVNDNTVTWQDITNAMLSSAMVQIPEHYTVYVDLK